MKKVKPSYNRVTAIIGLVLLLGFIILLFWGSKYLISLYSYLDPQWSSSLLIILAVLLVYTLILAKAIHSISNQQDKSVQQEKATIYGNFVELWARLNSIESSNEIQTEHLRNQQKQMILWAADEVLKEYLELEKLTSEDEGQETLQLQAERIILAMRKDLGNKNLGIFEGDLVEILKQKG